MKQSNQTPKLFSVDNSEPITLEELIAANSDEGVTPLEADVIASVEALEVGEILPGGMSADIKRVQ